MPGVKLLIATVDKTAYMEPASFVRNAVIGQSIDRLSLSLLDHDGSLGTITAMSQVIIEKSDDAGVRYFGGVISRINDRIMGLRRQVRLECQDWTVLLDKALAQPKIYYSAAYANDKAIIQDIFARAYTDPTTQQALNQINVDTYVQIGRPIGSLTCNRQTLTQIMNVLAAHAIYEWYVDYFKNLHFYKVDAELSAIHLSDNPNGTTTFAYYDLERDIDAINLANAIIVVGGFGISAADLEYIVGDGVATEYPTSWIWLPLEGETLPQVWRNDGTFAVPVWTQLTVFREGDANYTGGANQMQWNSLQKTLTFGSAPPNLANAIRVNGRYQMRIEVPRYIKESFAEVGIWCWDKIIDSSLRTVGEAVLRAEREALTRKFGVTTYRLKTQTDGFEVGKQVQLTSTTFGLVAEPFVIERNIMRLLGGTTAEYELTLRRPFVA